MGNFQKVDFVNASKGRVGLSENEISIVVTKSKTPNYILMNNSVTKEVFDKGFSKLNVFKESSNNIIAFQFGKTGDIAVTRATGKKKVSWRLSNKQLVDYMMDIFGIFPEEAGHHKLFISGNKAQSSTDYVMYYIQKSGMEQVKFK